MKNTYTTNMHASARPDAGRGRSSLWGWSWILLSILLIGSVFIALNRDYLIHVSRERDLINVGNRIRAAIGAYHEASPGTAKTYPSALQQLLMDTRMLGEKKHLDYLPIDPITQESKWGEIKNAKGEVIGVHSLATGSPTWIGQWLAPHGSGSGAYAEWKFVNQE